LTGKLAAGVGTAGLIAKEQLCELDSRPLEQSWREEGLTGSA